MTISSRRASRALRHVVLEAALTLAPIGIAAAWQAPPPPPVVILPPTPAQQAQQFQQTVQQQQLSSQLQQSQLQQQLQQSVSRLAGRPTRADSSLQRQLRQADQAQAARDRAAQQDQLDRYQGQAALPRVLPQPAIAGSSH